MKRKHLLLLTTLLLSQSAPVWGMEPSDEGSSAAYHSAKKATTDPLDKVQGLQQSFRSVREAIGQIPSAYLNGEKVLFLGKTGSGKSTLTNFLLGQTLDIKEKRKLDTSNPIKGSEIGHERTSTTILPSLCLGPKNMVFSDCPGFFDRGGPEQDLINAYGIHQLFSGKFKILLAVEETDLTSKSGEFLDLMHHLTKVVPVDQLEGSLALVITKQGRTEDVDPRQDLKDILNTNPGKYIYALTKDVKRILLHLTDDNNIENRVPYFPYPNNTTGKYDFPEAREKILDSISCLKSMENPKVKLLVSDEAKFLVSNYAQEFNEKITHLISGEGLQKTVGYCNAQIDNNVSPIADLRANLGNISRYLKEIKDGLLNLSNISDDQFKAHLDTVFAPKGVDFFPTQKLRGMIETLSFLKSIENDVSYAANAWAHDFETILEKIQYLTKAPEITVNQDLLTLKGCILGTSDVVQALQNHQQTAIKTVNIFGLNTLFIDQDIMSPGTCLNFVAPQWKVLGNKTINLCGLAGSPGAHGINPGEDGQPGKPGGNGGNLFGFGSNFYDPDRLTVNTNGGSGGAGGNGMRGRDGAPGRDGDLTVRTVNGNFTYYNAQGTDGQTGQNGGRCGSGGLGGHQGWAFIDGLNAWNQVSVDGTVGALGNVAAGGIGGVHGRHCQGALETGRTKPRTYTAYRPATLTRRVYSHQTPDYETRTRRVAYEVRDIEDTPVGFTILSGILTGGLSLIPQTLVTRTHYKNEPYQHQTGVTTHYKDEKYEGQESYSASETVSDADLWHTPLGYQPARGSAPNGNLGNGFNTNGQQNLAAQAVLDRNHILLPYRVEYQQGAVNPLTVNFVKAFPNL